MLSRARTVAVVLLVALATASTAQAYLLPADFLLRMVADKRRRMGMRDMSIQLQTELADATVIEERLYLKQPERLRWVSQEEPERLRIEREGARAAGPSDKVVRLAGKPDDLMAALMMPDGKSLDDSTAHLLDVAAKAGIDVKKVTLARQGETIAYIIGAEPWESDKPQLWIDKERFLPVRWVLPVPGSGGSRWRETRLLDYGSSTGGDWFPQVVEIYENGVLARRATVVKIDINQNLPETLFDLP